GRPQVREDESGELVGRVRALTDALLEPAAGRLPGCLQALPVDVVDPAVIAAAEAALDGNAELERRAAVRAVQMQDADAATPVTEHHEILAEDPHAQRCVDEIAGEGHRLPEAAQVLPARRAGPDFGELPIGRHEAAAVVAIEWALRHQSAFLCAKFSRGAPAPPGHPEPLGVI